jgi:hypothetical protein
MNLMGGPKRSIIGAVVETIGSSLARISAAVTEDGIGPTPDDPVIVTCGALYRESRGSNCSLIALIRSPASPASVAMTKIPSSCT